MPLTYLLYRCPGCGHDPLEGVKDEATCPACGLAFARGGEGGLILGRDSSGGVWEGPGHRLSASIEGRTVRQISEFRPEGASIHRAEVIVRRSGVESPVRFGGELLGFAEAMGGGVSGTLDLSKESLTLRTGPEAEREDWPLLHIRAVQTSSSTLQFSPVSGGLVEFRFPNDSPFRWETLLRESLRLAYRREGLGEIVEFQPRIVAE
jgi:hypothetical protein